jgi:hypothetical protein
MFRLRHTVTAIALLLFAASGLKADEDPSQHEQVLKIMSADMLDAVNQLKKEQRDLAAEQNRLVDNDGQEMEVLFIGDHPVAVAATDENGKILVTEF